MIKLNVTSIFTNSAFGGFCAKLFSLLVNSSLLCLVMDLMHLIMWLEILEALFDYMEVL